MDQFCNWLALHDFDADILQDVITAYRTGTLSGSPFSITELRPRKIERVACAFKKEEYFEFLVRPAFETAFAECPELDSLFRRIEFADLSLTDGAPPHMVDNGPEDPVLVAMNWQGTYEDMICLGHEVAHALQVMLSLHAPMPPVARETCAFLGELFVLDHARHTAPDLHEALRKVWCAENNAYLGTDIEVLEAALADPQATYHYRQNYPIARLAAVEMFRRSRGNWLCDLFAAGVNGMRHLPLEAMANRAGDIANYLPPFPETGSEPPATDAYRSLGAMALIDIDYWQGEAEKRIEDYYAGLLRHLRDRTAFVALDESRKPIGYATWTKTAQDRGVTLTRQAAPFGDHLTLQRSLQRHLFHEAGVSARHDRSARQEQAAW